MNTRIKSTLQKVCAKNATVAITTALKDVLEAYLWRLKKRRPPLSPLLTKPQNKAVLMWQFMQVRLTLTCFISNLHLFNRLYRILQRIIEIISLIRHWTQIKSMRALILMSKDNLKNSIQSNRTLAPQTTVPNFKTKNILRWKRLKPNVKWNFQTRIKFVWSQVLLSTGTNGRRFQNNALKAKKRQTNAEIN